MPFTSFKKQKPENVSSSFKSFNKESKVIEEGNIDLSNRPKVKMDDGSVATVRSISVGTDKGEVLIPTVVDGNVVSNEKAIEHYKETGEHLGIYKDRETATQHAENIHKQEEKRLTSFKTFKDKGSFQPIKKKSEVDKMWEDLQGVPEDVETFRGDVEEDQFGIVDPSEPPTFSRKEAEKYGDRAALRNVLVRPSMAFTEAAIPGSRRKLAETFAALDSQMSRQEALDWAESIDKKEWYKKMPEAVGWTAEMMAEYKLLSGAFKITRAGALLDKIGFNLAKKVAPKVLASEAASTAGKQSLKVIAKDTAAATIKSAPKTTQFMGIWGMLNSVKRGEDPIDGYEDGVLWGAALSAAVPAVFGTSRAIGQTKWFEKSMTRFDVRFPRIADKLKGTPSKQSRIAVLDDLKQEGLRAGYDVPGELNITNLNKTAKNIVKSLARRRDYVLKRKEMINFLRKKQGGPKGVEATEVVADEVAKQATSLPASPSVSSASSKVTKKGLSTLQEYGFTVDKINKMSDSQLEQTFKNIFKGAYKKKDFVKQETEENIYMRMPLERVKADAKHGVQKAKDALPKRIEKAKNLKKELANKKRSVSRLANDKRLSSRRKKALAKITTGKHSTTNMNNEELDAYRQAIEETDDIDNAIDHLEEKKEEFFGTKPSTDKALNKLNKKRRENRYNRMKKVSEKAKRLSERNKNYGYVKQFEPKRDAVADFEYDTGAFIAEPINQAETKRSIVKQTNEKIFDKIMAGRDPSKQLSSKEEKQVTKELKHMMANLTHEENNRIANWMFSEESRAKVGGLTEKEQNIADKLTWFAQEGPLARERMEEITRRWMNYGKKPSDIDNIYSKKEQEIILKGAEKAKKNGNFKNYINKLFDNNIRYGLRKYYYPSQGDGQPFKSPEALKTESGEPLTEQTATSYEPPSTIGRENLPRQTKGSPKKGSVFNNFRSTFIRTGVRNAIADDIVEVSKEINRTGLDLHEDDKVFFNKLFDSMMERGSYTSKKARAAMSLSRTFWRHHMSFVSNPSIIASAFRNSLQIVAQVGQSVNLREFTKNGLGLYLDKMLGKVDKEMQQDYETIFKSKIDQRQDIYKTIMFREIGKKAEADNIPKRALDAWNTMLDSTGFLYLAPDYAERSLTWQTVYRTAKKASQDYNNGKISFKKLANKTQIDTLMSEEHTDDAIKILNSGDSRKFANYVSEKVTFDTYREYSSTGRAGEERTPSDRLTLAMYPYFRGLMDLYYKKTFKAGYEGFKEGNAGKMKRAAGNLAKGIVGAWTADRTLREVTGKTAYGWTSTTYSILAPGVIIPVETISEIGMNQYLYMQGEITKEETINNSKDIIYEGMDDMFKLLPDLDKSESKSSRGRQKRKKRSRD